MKKKIITIDGPAASGKGKIAKYISRKWKLKHLDSGILYRKIAFHLIKNKINHESHSEIKNLIKNISFISFRNSKKLRYEKVSKLASKIATLKFIRLRVNEFQRSFVKNDIKNAGFVIDGRDIGSVVFKNADLKLYIEVSEINRAKRRYKQLIDIGEKSIYRQILKDIKLRDKKDKNRFNSPLIVPIGAHIINNNESFKKTASQINYLVGKKLHNVTRKLKPD